MDKENIVNGDIFVEDIQFAEVDGNVWIDIGGEAE
jgi:hypothetical protein